MEAPATPDLFWPGAFGTGFIAHALVSKSLRPPTWLLPLVASGGSDGSCRRPRSRMYLGWPPARLIHRSSQHLAVLGLGRPLGLFVRPIPFGGRSLGIRPSSGPYSTYEAEVRLLPRKAPSFERGSQPSSGLYSAYEAGVRLLPWVALCLRPPQSLLGQSQSTFQWSTTPRTVMEPSPGRRINPECPMKEGDAVLA